MGDLWGTGVATGEHVDGAPIRRKDERLHYLRRPAVHLHDERLDLRLPPRLLAARPTLLFPSVHRSGSGTRCFTVHPLGNPGAQADLGGRPGTLVPTDPRGMAALLRSVREESRALGLPSTFEVTHHGPEVALPAFFAEIAVSEEGRPSDAEVSVLATAIVAAVPDPRDQVALAVGGGHYAPHFTDLVRSRRWAVGHILSRHALQELAPATARAAWAQTPGARGILYARAQDRDHPAFAGIGPALRDSEAPARDAEPARVSGRSPPTSGT